MSHKLYYIRECEIRIARERKIEEKRIKKQAALNKLTAEEKRLLNL